MVKNELLRKLNLHKTINTFFERLYFCHPEQRLGTSIVCND